MFVVPIVGQCSSTRQTRPNETRILPLQALNDAIPPGTVLVGEDILWFALHQQRTFIGFNGFWVNYSGHQDRTVAQNLDALGVDALLLDSGNPDWKTLIDTGMYQLSDSFTISNSTYQLYRRSPQQLEISSLGTTSDFFFPHVTVSTAF